MTFEEYTYINEYNDNYNPVVAVKLTDDKRLINNNQELTDYMLQVWREEGIRFNYTDKTTIDDIKYAVEEINKFEKNAKPNWIMGTYDFNMKNILAVHKNDVFICNYQIEQ